MALKKSELYSSLWESCDVLRGGMDASQYKDYVLVMLFLKYISDKYAGQPYAPIQIPEKASFNDLKDLKGNSNIGDLINKQIIAPIAAANQQLSQSDFPDFNDPNKLGSGKDMVDRLTELINAFDKPELDFASNRADGDDILGDAYEYLMRHFATESGKSKGQFYTPAEVSRILAHLIGIHEAKTTPQTTAYDPTCGSGSLLLKVAAAAPTKITLYGQEMDSATAGLARMNMILHDNAEAEVKGGHSTLSTPWFKDKNGSLQTFDYVVANPPFSVKRWSHGFDPVHDLYNRFSPYGIPPEKQGDYAFLLHIVSSMKSTGKAACILPHGVLFRGNAEAEIRKNLIQRGYIKGIIGLPANLFYGTGIPACILVLDKEGAAERKGIFLIDASKGFLKDGNKNRLREQDIHKIVDTFTRQLETPKYSRMVGMEEIEKNDFNLNLPRYIDSTESEDIQDIEGHLKGGIPECDIDALEAYWKVCPSLRDSLFTANRPGYLDLAIAKDAIKPAILDHPDFAELLEGMGGFYRAWQDKIAVPYLQGIGSECRPKEIIDYLGESLLANYQGKPLLDPYDIYQHLRDYWAETMQDDCYLISGDGWIASTRPVIETIKSGKKKGETKITGWVCDLVPKEIVVRVYFHREQAELDSLAAEVESLEARLVELQDEYGGDGAPLQDVSSSEEAQEAHSAAFESLWNISDPISFNRMDKIRSERSQKLERLSELSGDPILEACKNPKGKVAIAELKKGIQSASSSVQRDTRELFLALFTEVKTGKKAIDELIQQAQLKINGLIEKAPANPQFQEILIIREFIDTQVLISEKKSVIKEKDKALDQKCLAKYPTLTEAEVKHLVIEHKWMDAIGMAIHNEIERISQTLTQRVKELAERYETTLPQAESRMEELEKKVSGHLQKMGFSW
jgi:type I restriction enzyme M protein